MIVLFTKKYGKISAGTSISEKGKNKSALALRPFTYGRYELYKNKDSYNINGAETLESFFSIGEDVDKYMTASYALELTDHIVMEDEPAPALFNNIYEFLSMLEKRKAAYDTLLIGFMIKALQSTGNGPVLDACIGCGSKENLAGFSVRDGGLICSGCTGAGGAASGESSRAGEPRSAGHPSGVLQAPDPLNYSLSNDIISALEFIGSHSLKALEGLALPAESESKIKKIFKAYYSYHLGIENLKSEGLKI